MIKHHKHNEIDKQKWDEAITSSKNPLIYAYSWWIDTVCPNWEALIENDYETMVPLTCRKKYGVNYLFQPHFTQQLGVFSKEKITSEKVEMFINSTPKKYSYIDICLNSCCHVNPNSSVGISKKDSSLAPKMTFSKNVNYELKLNLTYESLQKAYSENTKRNIKKAGKNALKIHKNKVGLEKIIQLFKQSNKAAKNLKKDYFEVLKKIESESIKRNLSEILSVHDETGKLLAAALFITSFNRKFFLFSGNSEEGKKTGAMPFLLDSFIKRNSETETILDFEGSNNPGLARFYQSFGSMETVYLRVKINRLPKPVKWLKK
ncbi:MAG: hypothetical protein COA57_14495 [Flavobacteriales bacterium]|nr:MAG: hypothetical protein COA57_14495 [Flavobacteriales bacterium]